MEIEILEAKNSSDYFYKNINEYKDELNNEFKIAVKNNDFLREREIIEKLMELDNTNYGSDTWMFTSQLGWRTTCNY